MPDDVLRVSTIVDLSALTAGIPNAASVVEASTARMNNAFGQVVSSTRQMDINLAATSASLSKQAGAALESQAQIQALQEQITLLNAKLTELEAKLANAPRKGTAQFMEARHAIMGAGEEIGVHLPRFITTFLSHLEGVAPIMAAAFSTIAIIGLIEIIPQLIAKIEEAAGALGGWDAAAKKAYADILVANNEMYLATLKNHEAYTKLDQIGTTGLLKIGREQKSAAATLIDYNTALAQATREAQKLTEEKAKLKGVEAWLTGEFTGRLEKEKLITDELAVQNKNINDFVQKIRELAIENAKLAIDLKVTNSEQAIASAKAVGDALKTVSVASLNFQEQSAKEMFSLGQITREQEVAALRGAEEQKYEVEKASIEKRKALAKTEEAVTGKAAGPELTSLEAQRETLEVSHQARMSAITTTGELDRRHEEDAAALATVAGARKIADAKVALEEQTARELRATRKISITEETGDLKTAENERFGAEQATLNKQLEIARQYPEKNRAQIIAMQSELEAAEISHQAKLMAIDAEGATAQIGETRRRMMEEIKYTQESANIQLSSTRTTIEEMFREHQIGLEQRRVLQTKAINDWYGTEKSALQQELALARTTYGEQSLEYKKLMDKLRILDQQRLKEVNAANAQETQSMIKMYDQMTNKLKSSMARWAAGYETTAQMWSKLWESMATTFATNVMKIIAQEILALTMHKALGKDGVLVDAKTAAAHTYSAVAAIPVIGPFLAPPAAVAAFAAVMAFGSFQRGGETGGSETMAHLHPREMVLGEHIATPLKAMLGSFSALTGRQLPVIPGSSVAALGGVGRLSVPSGVEGLRGGAGGAGGDGGAGGAGGFSAVAAHMGAEIARQVTTINNNQRGNMHLHYSPSVTSHGGNFESVLMEHAGTIARIMQRELRKGWSPA